MSIEVLLLIIMGLLVVNLLFSVFKFIWHLFTRESDEIRSNSSFLDLEDAAAARPIRSISHALVRPPHRMSVPPVYPPKPCTTKSTESKASKNELPRSHSDDSLRTVSLGSNHTPSKLIDAPKSKTK